MHSLLSHWLQSLAILKPQFLVRFIVRAAKNFGHTCAALATTYPWVLCIDLAFVIFFGCQTIKFIVQSLNKTTTQLHPMLLTAMLIIGVMGFLLQMFFVLFLRRDHFLLNAHTYIQTYAMRYIQFLFFTAFAFTFLRLFLLGLTIVKMPDFPELLVFLFKAFQMFALFFWLDSSHSVPALFRSFERAANLLLYTLPVILLIAFLTFGALALLISLVLGWDQVTQAPYAFATFVDFFVALKQVPSIGQVLTIKYGRLLIDGMTVTLLYTWYRRKRGVVYAAQLLPESEET